MKKISSVITSIFNPTQGVDKLSKINLHRRIVVGDYKTPSNWSFDGFDFLSIKDQNERYERFSKILPLNHYCRKNLGYLHAIRNGSDVIYDTDDDNILYDQLNFPKFSADIKKIFSADHWVNPYQFYLPKDMLVWPRGYPIEKVRNTAAFSEDICTAEDFERVSIWQGLADLDPDVDSIYRMIIGKEVKFVNAGLTVYSNGVFVPINSQNTFFSKKAFPLLYLPHTVSFRFTDILRGYIANAVLWASESLIGYFGASVFQLRNQHNLLSDFNQEIPFLTQVDGLCIEINNSVSSNASIIDNMRNVYIMLNKRGVVLASELESLEEWFRNIQS